MHIAVAKQHTGRSFIASHAKLVSQYSDCRIPVRILQPFRLFERTTRCQAEVIIIISAAGSLRPFGPRTGFGPLRILQEKKKIKPVARNFF